MTQRKRWLKTREFEKGECVAVRRPGKADTDRNAKRPPFVCVLVWVYFVHERFESGFRDLTLCVKVLRTPAALKAPPQTDTLAQRALEEWERTLCENKAVAILAEIQAGRPTIIHKDGGEMLIAIVLDKPLEEAKRLVDDPAAFTREMTRILRDKHTHPLIAQMMKPAESSEPPSATASASGASSSRDLRTTPHEQFQ